MAVVGFDEFKHDDGSATYKVYTRGTEDRESYFYTDENGILLLDEGSWNVSANTGYVRARVDGETELFHNLFKFLLWEHQVACVDHINGIPFDNVDANLREVTPQQNQWNKPSRGYKLNHRNDFETRISVNGRKVHGGIRKTEVEIIKLRRALELEHYKDCCYDFTKDRRDELELLDRERRGEISADEAIREHVRRYEKNAWYYYRYSLEDYFRKNNIDPPDYDEDDEGYMIDIETREKLCPSI